MQEQIIGKSIYHRDGDPYDQHQMLGRTALYDEDGNPLHIVTEESSNSIPFPITAYGALDDGSDCSAAIALAVSAAKTNEALGRKSAVVFPPSNVGYTVATPQVIDGVDVIMYGALNYSGVGAQSGPALTVGNLSGSFNKRYLRLMAFRTSRDWSTPTDVGVRIVNAQTCFIELIEAQRFTIGFQCMGDAAGFVYNTVVIGRTYDCALGLDLTNKNSGWINENLFLNGSFRCASSTLTTTPRTGIRITSEDASYTPNNNNIFLKPSFEMLGTNVALPIDIVHGNHNQFLWCRSESNRNDYGAIVRNASQNNVFEWGFIAGGSSDAILEEGQHSSSIVRMNGDKQLSRIRYSTPYSNGRLIRSAYDSNGAGAIGIAGLIAMSSANGNYNLGLTSVTLGTDFVEFGASRGYATFIDTSVVKTFRATALTKDGTGGRFYIKCFDSNGTLLTNLDPGHPYVKGNSAGIPAWNSAYGGIYRVGTDTDRMFFTVAQNVAYILVGFHGGATPTKLIGFTIDGLTPGVTSAWTHRAAQHGVDAKYATAVPSIGTYEVGDVIWNATPSAGGAPGWVCVTAGTPGTWKAMANLAP